MSNVYLHSSLVIPQVKGTVANPEVCMLLLLSNTSLELKMTQSDINKLGYLSCQSHSLNLIWFLLFICFLLKKQKQINNSWDYYLYIQCIMYIKESRYFWVNLELWNHGKVGKYTWRWEREMRVANFSQNSWLL